MVKTTTGNHEDDENMAKDEKGDKTDWEPTDKALARHDVGRVLPSEPHSSSSIAGVEGSAPLVPQGAIAQYQAGGVQRKAALAELKAWHDAKLEVTQYALAQAVRIKTAEASGMAEQILAQLDAERIEYLRKLGMKNVGARQEALNELTVQTAKSLREAQEQDVPDEMLQANIEGIMQVHKHFFSKLINEVD